MDRPIYHSQAATYFAAYRDIMLKPYCSKLLGKQIVCQSFRMDVQKYPVSLWIFSKTGDPDPVSIDSLSGG